VVLVQPAALADPRLQWRGAAIPRRRTWRARASSFASSPAFFNTGRRGKSHRIHGGRPSKTSPITLTPPRTGSQLLRPPARPRHRYVSLRLRARYSPRVSTLCCWYIYAMQWLALQQRSGVSVCYQPYGDRRCIVYGWCIQSYASWLTCKLDPAARDLSAVQYRSCPTACIFLSLFITRLRLKCINPYHTVTRVH